MVSMFLLSLIFIYTIDYNLVIPLLSLAAGLISILIAVAISIGAAGIIKYSRINLFVVSAEVV